MNIWLIMIAIGVITYATRLSFILLLERVEAHQGLYRALRFVPIAVLSAIIVPEMFIRDGVLAPGNPRLLAGLVAFLVAWRTRNALLTIMVGMAVLLVLQFFLGR